MPLTIMRVFFVAFELRLSFPPAPWLSICEMGQRKADAVGPSYWSPLCRPRPVHFRLCLVCKYQEYIAGTNVFSPEPYARKV